MRRLPKLTGQLALLLVISLAIGCQQDGNARAVEAQPDPAAAQKELIAGTNLIQQQKYDEAERHLQLAMQADPYSGLSHNSLGWVHYKQGKMYLAAQEFQAAAKLLPDRPEPLNNLGLVFEAEHNYDDAILRYADALKLAPNDLRLMGNLARAHVRRGDRDDTTRQLLTDLVAHDNRPDWLPWERSELIKLDASHHISQ